MGKGHVGKWARKLGIVGKEKCLSSKSIATGEKSGYVDRGGCFVGAKWL